MRSGRGDGVVRATAGSGKTTTLVEIAHQLPDDLNACFMAFNKHTAAELSARLPGHVRACTVHQFGNRSLRAAYPHLRQREPQPKKLRHLVREHIQVLSAEFACSKEDLSLASNYLYELVRFAMLNLTDPRHDEEIAALAIEYNLTPPTDHALERQCHLEVRTLLRRRLDVLKTQGIYDYEDMLHLPAALGLPVEQFDFVFVDEAQDLNAVQLELVLRAMSPGGRRLFVGDERQAIYGFAGADTDSLQRIVQRTNATILPLSITYRCPRSHVALARQLAPEIEAAPDAEEGNVAVIPETALDRWLRPGALVLCRFTAPLVQHCLAQVRAGRPAVVRGMDIGQRLADMAKQLFPLTLEGWEATLQAYALTEEARIRRSSQNDEDLERQLMLRRDLILCLTAITRDIVTGGSENLSALLRSIARLFSDQDSPVVFSTIHKAKGKEADLVLILYPESMPAVYARTANAARGEACVQFVALTRSKRDLIFVQQPPREHSIVDRLSR
ncbi:UvrD-helicase domain-containing protein [Deinococcus ruber]|uniref:UvrD-helicase domain-containing protein n=1 Tax=Deinococcus ruber TaxID=1848197 RepID=UPI00227D7AB6|nr:UvrD-helicase domain-containing protein [Deinococcus ruber]